jgi:hypothetical protein
MHFARLRTSPAIPVAGVAMMLRNTLPAASSRSVGVSRLDSAQPRLVRLNKTKNNTSFFKAYPLFL